MVTSRGTCTLTHTHSSVIGDGGGWLHFSFLCKISGHFQSVQFVYMCDILRSRKGTAEVQVHIFAVDS